MSRERRNRLVALGASRSPSAAGREGGGHRPPLLLGSTPRTSVCRDRGGPVPVAGVVRLPAVQSMALADTSLPSDGRYDWGWPPVEPSGFGRKLDPTDSGPVPDPARPQPRAMSLAMPAAPQTSPTAPAPIAAAPAASAKTRAPLTPFTAPTPAVSPAKRLLLADDETDEEIAAILREKGLSLPDRSPPPSAPQTVPSAPDATPPSDVTDRHAIFGQLGRTMAHANSFQLGRFNLDQHFNMLEEGMSWHPVSPSPAGAHDLHDLDVMSELTALSEAAGVPLRKPEDRHAFQARAARAQGVSLADLAAAEDEQDQVSEDEFTTVEDAAADEHTPWSPSSRDDEENLAPQEDDNG